MSFVVSMGQSHAALAKVLTELLLLGDSSLAKA
jgi:hypothetical protein